MKKRSNGRKTIRNRSKTGAGELTVSTGMTLWEYRQRPGRAYNGKPPVTLNGCWQMISAVGLSTSGALSGLRASSFPNPPMGPPIRLKSIMRVLPIRWPFLNKASSWDRSPQSPPKSHKDGNFWIPLKYGDVLSAPYYSTKVGAQT